MNQKTGVCIAIVVLAVIALAGLSYWSVQEKQGLLAELSGAKQQIQNLQQENAAGQEAGQEVIPTDQELFNAAYATEDMGQWKQYESSAMNVIFRYPSALIVKETNDEITVIDPSQPSDTDGSRMITLKLEKGRARDLSAKYIGFNRNVQWNPYSESSRPFASGAARIPHGTGDSSRYATYLFPNGFVDVNQISPAESAQWTDEKIQNQAGTLVVATTVSDTASDDLVKKAEGATNMDLYEDLPARILSTLRFVK